jgi:hypothetical protein
MALPSETMIETQVAIACLGYYFLERTPVCIILAPSRWHLTLCAFMPLIAIVEAAQTADAFNGVVPFWLGSAALWLMVIVGGIFGSAALVCYLPTSWERNETIASIKTALIAREIPLDRTCFDFSAYEAKENLEPYARRAALAYFRFATTDGVNAPPRFLVEDRDGKTFIAYTDVGVEVEARHRRERRYTSQDPAPRRRPY